MLFLSTVKHVISKFQAYYHKSYKTHKCVTRRSHSSFFPLMNELPIATGNAPESDFEHENGHTPTIIQTIDLEPFESGDNNT